MEAYSVYWKYLQRLLPLLLLASALAALAAYSVAKSMKPAYEVHYSYIISLSTRDDVEDYRFDGFYALQASDLFSSTLAQWVTAPETIVSAYRKADIPIPAQDARMLTRRIRAAKVAPQMVAVTVRHESADMAERIAAAVRQVMEDNIARYHDDGIPAVRFQVIATDSWTGVSAVSVPVITIATFVFTLFLLANAALLHAALREHKEIKQE